MTETPDNQPVCESESTDRPVMPCGLPMRNRIQPQDADSLRRLWQESECYDRAILEHVAIGLHRLSGRGASYRLQQEVDGVIERWRATRDVR
ncbi:Uncharacterised protein [Nocardia farcinica]|uniref:Uncharacterized protein n=1 Tax=Nocardia farcinica TaxID=37329 RepID=A0A449H8Y8_NOCFR|nr:Uncharacterised protein [Nocardia farcinica]